MILHDTKTEIRVAIARGCLSRVREMEREGMVARGPGPYAAADHSSSVVRTRRDRLMVNKTEVCSVQSTEISKEGFIRSLLDKEHVWSHTKSGRQCIVHSTVALCAVLTQSSSSIYIPFHSFLKLLSSSNTLSSTESILNRSVKAKVLIGLQISSISSHKIIQICLNLPQNRRH